MDIEAWHTRAKALGSVAIIVGGDSHEREISFMSLDRVSVALRSLGVSFCVIDLLSDLVFSLKKLNMSRVMLLAHGRNGEDGRIQGLLDLMKIPYTGSFSAAVSFNKWLCKLVWAQCGLNVPRGFLCCSYEQCQSFFEQLSCPAILKPLSGGSTQGISLIRDRYCLSDAYEKARAFHDFVILEEYIEGDEVTCGFLDKEPLPVIRLSFPGEVYDFHEKYFGCDTTYHCPSGLGMDIEKKIQSATMDAARSLNCHFWGRVDAIVRKGRVYLLEMNPIPGLTHHSLYPMALKEANIPFELFLLRLLESACVG